MKTIIKALTILLIFIFNLYASDFSKIDPKLKMLMDHPRLNKLYYPQSRGLAKPISSPYANVIIKTSASVAALNNAGVKVQAVIGDIVTASIAVDRINDLVQRTDVTYIQTPKTVTTHTDVSVPETRADPFVYQQYGVSGENVIIGIIDTGIDWRHEDFLKADGTTRIKYLLDFSDPGDPDGDGTLNGLDDYGGTLYTEQQINNALSGGETIPENDVVGHGTHVAGCAAGNGLATGNGFAAGTYVGVAPDADLIIVKATRVQGSRGILSTDYLNALNFIDSKAGLLGKPYVVNMSLGSNEGPHDGTSLEEQAVDQLIGSGIPGKVIVISAGNEGENAIHASGIFSSAITSIETKFKIESYDKNLSTLDDWIVFEIWYDGSADLSIKLIAPDSTIYGPIARRSDYGKNTDNGAIFIDNASSGSNPNNWDNQAIIQIYDFEEDKPPQEGEWNIVISGVSGRFDVWLDGASMNNSGEDIVYFSSNVDESMLVGNPGTAKDVITVGSYVTKNSWTDIDGKSISFTTSPELYTASSFSSPGPTRDWRTKPEISAPGEWITSSLSEDAPSNGAYSIFNSQSESYPNGYICQDGKHGYAQGTSMSAPHVTGVIALMLESNPNLDASQIKTALIASTVYDKFTLSIPNNKWGYGKLDAFAAMQYISGQAQQQKMSVSIFQNPALTQYIDFYLITKESLQSTPTATIQVGSNSPSSITMTAIDSLIYKGEYQFSFDGTAILTIKATIQGESETTLTEYFGVTLLKPNLGGTVTFENVDLSISKNSFQAETYFTILPVAKEAASEKIQPISKAYQFGPSNYSFDQSASLIFNYDNEIVTSLDEQKLSIYVFENGCWNRLTSHVDIDGNTVTTTIDQLGIYRLFYDPDANLHQDMPDRFQLYQNFPNPFNANTAITYYLPDNAEISIRIFNVRGELVATLFEGKEDAGFHKIIWNGRNLNDHTIASGLYFYRLSIDNFSVDQKMLLLK